MQPQVIVEYGEAKLVVVKANGLMGMRRAVLAYHGVEANKAEIERTQQAGDPEPDQALLIWRASHYPDLIAAVQSAAGKISVYDDAGSELTIDLADWPPLLEQVMLLPDELISAWEVAVFEMNPHWARRPVEQAAQKKEPSSGSA